MQMRLVQPEYTIATSDGIRNGTREMRYSLIGREVTHDALCEHLEATGLAGTTYVDIAGRLPTPEIVAAANVAERRLPMSIAPAGNISWCAKRIWQAAMSRRRQRW